MLGSPVATSEGVTGIVTRVRFPAEYPEYTRHFECSWIQSWKGNWVLFITRRGFYTMSANRTTLTPSLGNSSDYELFLNLGANRQGLLLLPSQRLAT